MTEERTIEDAVERIEDEHSSLTLDWLLPSSVLQAIRTELEAAAERGRREGLREAEACLEDGDQFGEATGLMVILDRLISEAESKGSA